LSEAPQYGLDEQQLRAFIAPMLEYDDPELREFAQARHRLFALRDVAVELKAPTLAGEPFDLRDLRGKIVLVDYWATTCSSCIAAMPRIKAVYDRYRERGFEVLSVCFDGKAQRKRVERAEKEMGLTWTTLAADDLRSELKRRYGYESVPQYMLLDRQGRLVAGTSEIDMGRNLEALLEQMLAKEAAADGPGSDR
jgi:thiol-disulfide isomerase/thioredoxin